MAEKVRSGWSNLLLLAQRKNVVKGSYRENKLDITKFTTKIQSHPQSVFTLLVWISIGTIMINITKMAGLPCNIHANSPYYFIVILFCRRLRDSSGDQLFIHSIQA